MEDENIKSGISQHTQIVNLSLYDQTIFVNPSNEDKLKILKVECLSNHL
jgi:hypothetical protein